MISEPAMVSEQEMISERADAVESLSVQTRATERELLRVLGSPPPKPSLLPLLSRLSLASTQTSLEKRWKDEHQGALSRGGQERTTLLKPQRSPPPTQSNFQRVSFPRRGNIPERKGSPLDQNSEEDGKEKPLRLPGLPSLTLAHGNFAHCAPALSSPASERFADVDQAGHFGLIFFVSSAHRGDGALWQFAAALRHSVLGILGGFPKGRQQLGSCGLNTWGMWRVHPVAST